MEFISKKTNFNFIGQWKFCVTLSILAAIGSIYIWVAKGESKYGVDFQGGHEIVVRVKEGGNSDSIRSALSTAGLNEAIVQSFEIGSNQYSIRLGGSGQESTPTADSSKIVADKVLGALNLSFNNTVEILKTDYVGPTVGKELRFKATLATFVGLVAILLYMSFRFEFSFALGAVVAIFHDVIIATGIYLAAGFTINMGTIAAALTILGYSVHDTIVVFDRVREEIFKRKDFSLAELMNDCINATLSRTIITTLLTVFSVLALLVLGGGSIADLNFFLLVGLICGTYSTVYVASPVVLAWEYFRNPALKHKAEAQA